MWEIIGNRTDRAGSGMPVRVRWEEGTLSASASDFLTAMDAYALMWGMVGQTPVGPWIEADVLDEKAAYLIATALLKHVELNAGAIPEFPDLPAPKPGEAF